MLLKYPCSDCSNQIISDVDEDGTVPACCSVCIDENPLKQVICRSVEDNDQNSTEEDSSEQ